jgi:low temperature requirement protein LtrA
VPALALCGGTALYLVGLIASLYRATHHLFRRRTIGAAVLLALIPVAIAIPAVASLALVCGVCALVIAYEALRYRADRVRVRHAELTS